MFGTIRKHQTWLWVVIISLTIVSFVIFFSPYQRMGDGGRAVDYGSVSGEKVTQETYNKAAREIYLRYFFMSGGSWPDADAERQGFNEMRETYQWMLLVQKLEEMGIQVSPEAVADAARQMLSAFGRGGGSPAEVFRKQVLEPRGFNLEDFQRFVRHYLGLQELMSTAGMAGKLVTPEEVKMLYQRRNQQVAASLVAFNSSNYLSQVNVTPENIAQFYTNRLSAYRIPDRLQVNYVKFDITNYLDKAQSELGSMTNLNERVEAVYRQNTNLFADAKSPEEAKDRIREQMRRELASVAARRAANEFATVVFDREPVQVENLEIVAKEKGLAVQTTPPFDRAEPPVGMEVNQQFVNAAFRLSPTNDPFGGPILTDDAVYVIAYNKRLPSEIPPLESIRERVVNDYKELQAGLLARQAGMAFQQTLTNQLAQGKSFEEIAKGANVKVVELPPFSLSTQTLPEAEGLANLNQLKQMAFGTEPGKASAFAPSMEGGAILFVKNKLPVDPKKMEEELPAFSRYIRQTRQNEAFNEWFRREAERGLRDTPLNRPQTPDLQQQQGAAPVSPS